MAPKTDKSHCITRLGTQVLLQRLFYNDQAEDHEESADVVRWQSSSRSEDGLVSCDGAPGEEVVEEVAE